MKKLFFIIFAFVNLYSHDAYITPSALKNSLDDQSLVVVDISDSYKKSHIVGAVSFNVSSLIDGGYYKPLVDKEEIENLFSEIGIENNSSVVIYGRNSLKDIKNSAFLAFVLISHGFEKVSILDGGYMGWVFNYDTLTERGDVQKDFFTSIYELYLTLYKSKDDSSLVLDNNKLSVDLDYVRENNNTITLVDARYPQKYYGVSNNKDEIYIGHIPGAKNSHYPYKFLRDKTIRTQDELVEMYIDGLELDADKDIVVYGENPFEAAVEWYIIYKQMGFKNAKLYYNSFTEYVDWGYETERFKWE